MKKKNPQRTHTCGELRPENKDQPIRLSGWVHRKRDHGQLIFIDLRDRYGLTQVVFSEEANSELYKEASTLRSEDVISIGGTVLVRPENMVNKDLPTGGVEISADALEVLSRAETPPFSINEKSQTSETTRLKYRYLDLRRPELQEKFILRHRVNQALRHFLDDQNFLEIETPCLTRSTPEGARDYLVPSRLYTGEFYALPQSPQLFKQLLMIGGFDRYFQIARCFRDEDLRADRQPEFTQLDMELSFPDLEELYALVETMMAHVFQAVLGKTVATPFPRMSYAQALKDYGSDKPDMRWPLPRHQIHDLVCDSDFQVFQNALSSGGEIRGMKVPNGGSYSRKKIDQLTDLIKPHGAKGLIWMKYADGKLKTSIDKFLSDDTRAKIAQRLDLQKDDLGLILADQLATITASFDAILAFAVEDLQIPPAKDHAFLWIDAFPLFEYSAEDDRCYALHHPFTRPMLEDLPLFNDKARLTDIRSEAYDLVLNGFEIGGGSFRIHEAGVQALVFDALGISKEEAQQKFGFFMEALTYGTPPHGGIAFGLDRLCMILSGTHAIRDVIAFPKTQNAQDTMMQAPSAPDPVQMAELFLTVTKKPKPVS